jgi:beta-N-acetylhexosaminidase
MRPTFGFRTARRLRYRTYKPVSPSRRNFLAVLAHATYEARMGLASPDDRRAVPVVPDELLQLAGTCIVSGFYGQVFPAELRALARRGALGGVLVARHNFADRRALAALCTQIRELSPPDQKPLIAADQEGGPVAHLSPPLVSFPSMTALGSVDDVALTRRVGLALGSELASVGVSMDLAPVLDVRTCSANTVDLGRAFGRDAGKVARHGQALIEGLTQAGVLSCAKHFPGHGDAAGDSHAGLPRVRHGIERLEAVELVPFRACASQTPAVMLAHVVYEGVDPVHPASLSRAVIEGILRDRLHFDGVAMSDDLQMVAIRAAHPIEQACELSLRAGCDLLLVAHTSTLGTISASERGRFGGRIEPRGRGADAGRAPT